MDITSWNVNTGEPRVWKLTSAVRGRAGGKGLSHQYLACCLSYYDLDEPLPDHSSLTRIRERYGIEVFRRFFEKIVELCQHNEERHDWIEEVGAQDRRVSSRGYQRLADLRVSTTDPDATLMPTKDGADMGYHTHYVVDGGKARIILQVLVTASEVMDNQPMLDLL